MAKLHFLYSVMNAGKTTHLLQVRYNYVENGGHVLLFTRSSSRMGYAGARFAWLMTPPGLIQPVSIDP